MSNPAPITSPISGESVTKLWRHVEKLVQRAEAQSQQIEELKARFAGRRKMDNAPGGGSLNYRGDYSLGTVSYAVGDIVRVTSGNNAGIWICVQAHNSETPIAHAPIYPEPVSPDTLFWHLWAFSPKLMSYSQSGTQALYINASGFQFYAV